MSTSPVEIPVSLDRLVCKSDGTETKFYVARNTDDGTIYGKPGRTTHVIPHQTFFSEIDSYIRVMFFHVGLEITGSTRIELPKSGARLIMVYPLKFDKYKITIDKGGKHVPYYPCLFAINTYDGLVTPRFILGIWKNDNQFSGSIEHVKIKHADHSPGEVADIGTAHEEFTEGMFYTAWALLVNKFKERSTVPAQEDAEALITWLAYNHIMVNNKQKTQLTELWSKIQNPTWLHKWEAITYVLNQGKGVEACQRLGKLFFS